MDFIDREGELTSLEDLWGMQRQVALLWGRRRVGKSTLLQRFAADKPQVFYQAVQGTVAEQLLGLTTRILAYRPDPVLMAAPLVNWDQAIAYLLDLARLAKRDGHPLLIVLDEFPYLVLTTMRLPSLLQAALEDVKREELPLYLVLSGSQISMFERHVIHGPLFGRRTWGEQLPPLDHRQAAEFFPGWTAADRLRAWAILGGVPYYLERFEATRTLAWNIEHRILEKGQVLYDEAEVFVKEELGADAATYLSVVAAVAGGATRQAEIADRVGQAPSAVSFYLDRLRRLHVVEHLRPINSGERARGVWRVADGYLRFWFRFVRPNLTDLEARRSAVVYRERVAGQLDHFVSAPAFEDACREHVRASIGSDPAFPARGEVGTWWGSVPDDRVSGSRRTRQGEIELVAYEGHRLVLAGEAKWQRGPIDTDVINQLVGTARHLRGYGADTRLAVYSRAGFSEQLAQRARAEAIILRTVDDLYRDPPQ